MNLCLAVNVLSQNNNAPRDNPSRGSFCDCGTSYVPTPVLTSFLSRGIILSEIKKGTKPKWKNSTKEESII